MSGSEVHQAERQTLLTRLLDAVKQCQVRFGGKTELATDGDARVSCLCSAWEGALQHGLRHNNKALSTLKQVTEITGLSKVASGIGLIEDFKNLETEPACWIYVKEFLNKHELQRYSLLKNIQTDAGRSRAWLRAALNEKSLERYMHMLLENNTLLKQYYEDWAFLCDEERSSMLPNMAAGLGSILFAINIDNAELNTIKPPQGLEHLVSATPPSSLYAPRVEEEPRPVIAGGEGSPVVKRKEKKKRKKIAHLVSFDDDVPSSYSASPSSSVTSPRSVTSSTDFGGVTTIVANNSQSSKTQEFTQPAEQSKSSVHKREVFSHSCPSSVDTGTVLDKDNSSRIDSRGYTAELAALQCQAGDISSANSDKTNSEVCKDNTAELKQISSVELLENADSSVLVDQTAQKVQRGDSTSEEFVQLLQSYSTPPNLQPEIIPESVVPSTGTSEESNGGVIEPEPEILTKDIPIMSGTTENKTVPVQQLVVAERLPRKDSESSLLSNSSQLSANRIPTDLTPLTAEGTPVEDNGVILDSPPDKSTENDSLARFYVPSYSPATDYAAYALAMAQKGWVDTFSQGLRTQGDGSHAPEPISPKQDAMSTAELKQAVVAMMLRKDEVEEQNRSLLVMLDSERDNNASLRAEVEEVKKNSLLRHEKDNEKLKALTRENELLKHQLKKYVNAVQMLRRQGAKVEDFPGIHVEDPQPEIPPPVTTIDYSFEASEYERKLIQVAEMHGELMEFNDILHRQLNATENQLKRLKQELVDLRGPLPDDLQGTDDSVSISSDSSNHMLINVWIPSAFLRGATSDAFHVYQVFVRIRDEEWNVYRRYTEFNDFHTKLKKKYPVIGSFDFPKKKAIGNKEPRFVEERRKKLQVYLRKVLNTLVQIHPELAANASRARLVEAITFFGDVPANDKKKKKVPTATLR